MLTHKSKIYLAITVIFMAVILLAFGLFNMFKVDLGADQIVDDVVQLDGNQPRHPLNGRVLIDGDGDFFPIAIMIDNSYDIRPQQGLDKADVIYEALAEGNITRLMAVFDSRQDVNKIGPVRSARKYYMDWAEEYGGVYMHVGGSPQALQIVDTYDFVNIDQIGIGEIYFWRDKDLWAPHNVFTSDSNWLRVGEIKEVDNIDSNVIWNFITVDDADISDDKPKLDFSLNFSGAYKVGWKFNDRLFVYQRWQTDDKFLYGTGEQAIADNIIVQVASARIVDNKERRDMDNKTNGQAFIFNKLGMTEGRWIYEDNRTRFFDADDQEFELVPGKTWVEVIPDLQDLILE
ncbi:DUF3048 domain-containing protein [Candidatus Parcubacteria bacterium]|jgi:hypothetical protein|nr:DUF3048 domain-containing protein [Candidatus Parcubacteria bacterium]